MRNISNTILTKKFVESKVSQELIFARYLNLDIEVIVDCYEYNNLIISPIRDDDNDGSFGFAYNNKGKLKARDFSGAFWGDCYDMVAYILSYGCKRIINISNKEDFYFVLKHIASTFSKLIYGKEVDKYIDSTLNAAIKRVKHQKSIIEIVRRNYNNSDKKIWAKWGIDLTYLQTRFVYAVDQYYINRFANPAPKYFYDDRDPCYAYVLGMNKKGIYNIKLYFPLRDKAHFKFITNSNTLEGIPNLELNDYDFIILTKSSKDRIAIGCHLYKYPLYDEEGAVIKIGIINVPSENHRLNLMEYNYIKGKLGPYGRIISFMDFDRTGIICAKYLKRTFDIPYIFITNGTYGFSDYGAKDFAELKEQYSDSVINEFINETITYINERD